VSKITQKVVDELCEMFAGWDVCLATADCILVVIVIIMQIHVFLKEYFHCGIWSLMKYTENEFDRLGGGLQSNI